MAKSRTQKKLERKQRKSKERALQYAQAAARKGHKSKAVSERPKRTSYSRAKINIRINNRCKEAQIRQSIYNHLTKGEKLALIASRPGASKNEVDKLAKIK